MVAVQDKTAEQLKEDSMNLNSAEFVHSRKRFNERVFSESEVSRFQYYTLEDYTKEVKDYGLEYTWSGICQYVKKYGQNNEGILRISEFGELYEIGLETLDKQKKKQHGQYYTPEDVAKVMSAWFDEVEGDIICDVACGAGSLILAYLNYIGREQACKILDEGKLYLYDRDYSALQICKTSILVTYGLEYNDKIHDIHCDFLDKNLILPENCKVITNPPYGSISEIPETWLNTEVQVSTKDLYTSFMEKIITQSRSSVHITPYSFLGGGKAYPLRKIMNDYSGFVVSFDNVPGTIFCGRKHGIFNTNTSNSVRAAITVVRSDEREKGFNVSPLIRFKASERADLLQSDVLKTYLTGKQQLVDDKNPMFEKCFKELVRIFEIWKKSSNKTLGDYVVTKGEYILAVPNTCRYYTVASNKKINRNGQILLEVNNEDVFNYLYCVINSSFAYWHWRIYDGGITYPKTLLLGLPLFYDLLTQDDKLFFRQTAEEMIAKANDFIITKNNVGIQENIRYPVEYRDKINQRLLNILKISANIRDFDLIHSNMATRIN